MRSRPHIRSNAKKSVWIQSLVSLFITSREIIPKVYVRLHYGIMVGVILATITDIGDERSQTIISMPKAYVVANFMYNSEDFLAVHHVIMMRIDLN